MFDDLDPGKAPHHAFRSLRAREREGMGEFGRTPQIGTQGSTDGRDHWPVVMSMLLAGGGLRHGQVIGATEADGGAIKARPVMPGDLAATIYRHFGVPLDVTYQDHNGRPRATLDHGEPIHELF